MLIEAIAVSLPTQYSQSTTSMASWLRHALLWSLGGSILVVVVGPFLFVSLFALTMFTVNYIEYSQQACFRRALSQSLNFIGITLVLVGTEVFVLWYSLFMIANMFQRSGIFLERLGRGIVIGHIGLFYLPFATTIVFQFAPVFFRCIFATWVHSAPSFL